MKKDWLWDRKISIREAKHILKDTEDPKFIELAALLLMRKNSPQEIFKEYISPSDFCHNWAEIKKTMKKDAWGRPRVDFWQAVFEKVKDKLNISVRAAALPKKDVFCKEIGDKIKELRKKRGLTQSGLARKLRISQQIISRIEKGQQNISLLTLKNIATSLQSEADFEFH